MLRTCSTRIFDIVYWVCWLCCGPDQLESLSRPPPNAPAERSSIHKRGRQSTKPQENKLVKAS